MSHRTVITCASLGLLALTAANVSPALRGGDVSTSLRSLAERAWASERPTATADTSGADFQLLQAVYGPSSQGITDPYASLPLMDEATLWLARAVYSETKLPHEQELVAWVIRNRVETGFRGRSTYKSVVLDPYQFSAFNPDAPRRQFYMSLTPETRLPAWQQALSIAHYVRHADPAYRPFSIKTRHFFSEVSMPSDQRFPYWVEQHRFVSPGWNYTVDARRFRFYAEIS